LSVSVLILRYASYKYPSERPRRQEGAGSGRSEDFV